MVFLIHTELRCTVNHTSKVNKNIYLYIKAQPEKKTEWKEYYGKLWNEQGSKGEEGITEERSERTDHKEDMITIEELNEVLKHAKKQEILWIR